MKRINKNKKKNKNFSIKKILEDFGLKLGKIIFMASPSGVEVSKIYYLKIEKNNRILFGIDTGEYPISVFFYSFEEAVSQYKKLYSND